MELREYWLIVRKWWWLLILCTLLGGGVSYIVSMRMTPTYEASTLLMIGGGLDEISPTTGELQTSEKLAQTYAELLKTRPILDATMAELGLDKEPELTVSLVRNTQLLRITVQDSSPVRAAATANELARQLIQQSPSDPEREEQAYRRFVAQQLDDLESEIASLSEVVMEARETASPDEFDRLQEELSLRRSTYSTLLSYLKGSSINYVGVIEPANVPTVPTSPKVLQNTLLAAVVGLMLAGGAAFLLEYLDNSVRDVPDIEQVLGLPSLGVVGEIAADGSLPELVSIAHPKSAYAEAYRILRTNLRYSLPADTARRMFLVTSVAPGEGKTTTAANLAVAMARAGQRTVLVDADMRRPSVHHVFAQSRDTGLSSLLVGEVLDVREAIVPSEIENLSILPCGPLPPNASELLGSKSMKRVLDRISEMSDVVILDSPPLFAVADSGVLASQVTGVILVAYVGQTEMQGVAQAAEVIKRSGGTLLGVVLNRLEAKRRSYYHNYYNYYYYNYYSSEDGENGHHGMSRRRREPSAGDGD